MHYSTEIVISLPRDRVVEAFRDRKRYSEWQPGLEAYEPLSGEPGATGSKARLLFRQNRRTADMMETVVADELPERYEILYETDGVKNREVNRFVPEGPDKTRWIDESEFNFTGALALMAPFLGGTFRRETLRTMRLFKTWVESLPVREPVGVR